MRQETKLNIYSASRPRQYIEETRRLQESQLSAENKQVITEFKTHLLSVGRTGELRTAKLSSQLRHICTWLNTDIDQLTKKELMQLIGHINQLDRTEATRSDYRRVVRQFFNWLKEEDPRLEEPHPSLYQQDPEKYRKQKAIQQDALRMYKHVKEINISYKRKQADPKTIISDKEILDVIEKGAHTPKEKAFLSCLHEWGARASEFLNLRVGDITLKENHAVIHVPDGKTGERIVYSYSSLGYLLRYLEVHPLRQDPSAFLWLSSANHNRNEPLLHNGARKLVSKCFERAGLIKIERAEFKLENGKRKTAITKKTVLKKHNLHWFRHSRATILAPKMTEAVLCKYMGWAIGSRQIRVYAHLCNAQIEDAFLNINGLKNKEQKEQPIKCACGTQNQNNARYCVKCFRPLQLSTALQDEEVLKSETGKTVQYLLQIMKDPKLLAQFNKFKDKQV